MSNIGKTIQALIVKKFNPKRYSLYLTPNVKLSLIITIDEQEEYSEGNLLLTAKKIIFSDYVIAKNEAGLKNSKEILGKVCSNFLKNLTLILI